MGLNKRLLLTTTLALGVILAPVTGRAAETNQPSAASQSSAVATSTTATSSTQTSQQSSSRTTSTSASHPAKRLDAPTVKTNQTATTTAKKTQETLTLTDVKVTKTAVTGHTAAGTTVQAVGLDQAVLGTAKADAQGNFKLVAGLTDTSFSLRATKTDMQSATWKYMAKLKVSKVKVAKTIVSGQTLAGAKIKLVNQKKKTVGTALASSNGQFTLHATKKVNTTPFTLKITKSGYHAASWKYTAPLKVSKVKVTKHKITGHTTAGATVKVTNLKKQLLGRAVVNKKGTFAVHTTKTVSTKPFNLSATKSRYKKVTWKYTAPQKLTHIAVHGKKVTGHAVAGATVQLVASNKVVGTAKANSKGNFTVNATRSLTTKTFTVNATKSRYHKAHWKYAAKKLNVPLIAQRPELPTGCEITAVTMMLQYKGCKVTKNSLALEMPRSSNPNKGFVGNPYTSYGWTIYPAGLMKLVKRHAHSAVNLTGVSVSRLKKQINKKHPVTLWVTGVDGFNTHALTMTGYSPTRIYYNDPWTNRKTSMTISSFKSHWKRDGYRALSY